jgi:PPM family protein phosphatase
LLLKHTAPEFDYSGLSHIGPVREDNQDSIQLPDGHPFEERGWLVAVADGMGGYAHGQVASKLALEKMFDVVYGEKILPAESALKRGVEMANLGVFKLAQQMGAGRMGTTITAACVVGNQLLLAHVGDSRAYLIRDHRAMCLTEDHTTVGELVRIKVLSQDKVRTHAQRSILTRGVGLTMFVKPDITKHTLKPGDRLVLCSDGVWSVIEDHEFAEVSKHSKRAHDLSQNLIDLALKRETDDNASAIAVHIHSLTPSPASNGNGRDAFAPIKDWLSRRSMLFLNQ